MCLNSGNNIKKNMNELPWKNEVSPDASFYYIYELISFQLHLDTRYLTLDILIVLI